MDRSDRELSGFGGELPPAVRLRSLLDIRAAKLGTHQPNEVILWESFEDIAARVALGHVPLDFGLIAPVQSPSVEGRELIEVGMGVQQDVHFALRLADVWSHLLYRKGARRADRFRKHSLAWKVVPVLQ